ncbi:MAG: protein YgfX [Pseudomonadota bacterium]
MSSKEYATPLRIEVGVNRLLRGIFLLFCALVGAVLLWLPWPLPLKMALMVSCFAAVSNVWSRRAELGGRPVSLVWDAEQRWWWRQAGRTVPLALLGNSYLSSSLVVLNFRHTDSRRRYAVVLSPRAVGAETFRRLSVRLKLSGEEVLAGAK